MEKFPYQYRQRGGSMKVSSYLALAILALAIGEAVVINYLYRHRMTQIQIQFTIPESPRPGATRIQTGIPDSPSDADQDTDTYVTHSFPTGRNVCTFVNTICYTRI